MVVGNVRENVPGNVDNANTMNRIGATNGCTGKKKTKVARE